jgi:hypothetical protein
MPINDWHVIFSNAVCALETGEADTSQVVKVLLGLYANIQMPAVLHRAKY